MRRAELLPVPSCAFASSHPDERLWVSAPPGGTLFSAWIRSLPPTPRCSSRGKREPANKSRGARDWRSARAARIVALNCAALPATLVGNELFGRERGAFTGAHTSQYRAVRAGPPWRSPMAVHRSRWGPAGGTAERLGSTRTVDVDVRVIAATNRDLAEEVREEPVSLTITIG